MTEPQQIKLLLEQATREFDRLVVLTMQTVDDDERRALSPQENWKSSHAGSEDTRVRCQLH